MKVNADALYVTTPESKHKNWYLLFQGASGLRPDRAFRSNLVYRAAAHKYFRFNPLRGQKSPARGALLRLKPSRFYGVPRPVLCAGPVRYLSG
jgi:hypothetical protein